MYVMVISRIPSPSDITSVVGRAALSDGEGDSPVFRGCNSSSEMDLRYKKKRTQKDAEFSSPEKAKTSLRLPGGKLRKANADLRGENEAL